MFDLFSPVRCAKNASNRLYGHVCRLPQLKLFNGIPFKLISNMCLVHALSFAQYNGFFKL